MSTTTSPHPDAALQRRRQSGVRARRSRFYLVIALIIAVIVLLGFQHSFFLRPLFHNPPLTPLAWLHGFVFAGWVIILIAQCTLVLRGRLGWHRKLGWFAAAYAGAMVLLGATVLIASMQRSLHGGDLSHAHSHLRFLLPFLGDMVLFGGLAAAGILLRRTPESHKRFMILASVSLLDAAFGRFGILFPFLEPVPMFWMDYGSVDLMALLILLADWRRCGRIHPVYALGVPVMFVWHAALFTAGSTAFGLKIAGLIVS